VITSLDGLFRNLEQGIFPPPDLGVTRVPRPSPRADAVIATTGHVVVAVDAGEQWLDQHVPVGDPGAAFNPPFLRALELHLNRRVNNIDLMTHAAHVDGLPDVALKPITDQSHPRVRRALRYRDDLTVYACPGGVLVIGRGLAGRWEAAIEVEPEARGRGLGRSLAAAARNLVPEDRGIWAQIAPGNAASLRSFLAAGYVPMGQEALLVDRR
jgi:GNAT superfamily N-acetyltransferase